LRGPQIAISQRKKNGRVSKVSKISSTIAISEQLARFNDHGRARRCNCGLKEERRIKKRKEEQNEKKMQKKRKGESSEGEIGAPR